MRFFLSIIAGTIAGLLIPLMISVRFTILSLHPLILIPILPTQTQNLMHTQRLTPLSHFYTITTLNTPPNLGPFTDTVYKITSTTTETVDCAGSGWLAVFRTMGVSILVGVRRVGEVKLIGRV